MEKNCERSEFFQTLSSDVREDLRPSHKAWRTMDFDVPGACQIKKKASRQPKKIYVQDSILMILEIVKIYKMEMKEAFTFIPNITASDCFVFCILAFVLH